MAWLSSASNSPHCIPLCCWPAITSPAYMYVGGGVQVPHDPGLSWISRYPPEPSGLRLCLCSPCLVSPLESQPRGALERASAGPGERPRGSRGFVPLNPAGEPRRGCDRRGASHLHDLTG